MVWTKAGMLLGLLVAGFSVLCSACAWTDQQTDAKAVLFESIDNIVNKANFAFEGKSTTVQSGVKLQSSLEFAGHIDDRNQVYIMEKRPRQSSSWNENEGGDDCKERCNPLQRLGQIRQGAQIVKIDVELSNENTLVLGITMSPKASKDAITSHYQKQLKALTAQDEVRRIKQTEKLTKEQEKRLLQELEKGISIEKNTLNAILNGLIVEEKAMLWIDRERQLPKQMRVTTTLNYKTQGVQRTETTEDTFLFKDDGKQISFRQ